jgi:hypothetical protein
MFVGRTILSAFWGGAASEPALGAGLPTPPNRPTAGLQIHMPMLFAQPRMLR